LKDREIENSENNDMDEQQIIKWLKKHCRPIRDEVILGIGDDTAVIDYSNDTYLLLTTDVVVDRVHFISDRVSPYGIGWKALGVNISDIAAMGGSPLWALVSVGMEKNKSDICKKIYKGILDLAKQFNIDIVGGNLSRSEVLFINIFLAGIVKKEDLVLRSTGKPNDILFVTGTLGGAQKRKQFSFIPRIHEAKKIIEIVKPSAMIDLSDGLASDAKKLAEASNCGFEIEAERIPVSADASRKNKIFSALYDGEDYELLFAVSPEYESLIPDSINNVSITKIGRLTEKKQFLLRYQNGHKSKISEEEFKHFT
jgi:thiamine-monophosphate kinase